MKHIFIINPAAGRESFQKELEKQIPIAAEACSVQYEIYRSTGVRDAEERVRAYCLEYPDDRLRFYSCGGDGTLNEVFNGVANFSNTEVAVIPYGTGNDFVKNFENNRLFLDIKAQINGNSIEIDGMKVGNRYAVNIVNMGFDCSVVETTAKIKRRPFVPSSLAYIFGVIIEFVKLPGVDIKKLVIDDEEIHTDSLLLCTFAGGAFYGGGFHGSPLARVDDGFIDICSVKPISRLKFASFIGRYKNGTHLSDPKIRKYLYYHKCERAYIDFGEERNICIDGEITNTNKLSIEIVPKKFNFVLPLGITYEATRHEEVQETKELISV
ncbi:MAG: diacylglycerol kinase family protein [Clostridia bacterium]|nr:diacylglycerol kinase family protein [Clostridia bacterium]